MPDHVYSRYELLYLILFRSDKSIFIFKSKEYIATQNKGTDANVNICILKVPTAEKYPDILRHENIYPDILTGLKTS